MIAPKNHCTWRERRQKRMATDSHSKSAGEYREPTVVKMDEIKTDDSQMKGK